MASFEVGALEKGDLIEINQRPYQVLELNHLHLARGGGLIQTKLKDLIEEKIIEKTFKSSEKVNEAEIKKVKLKFIYHHRNKFVFQEVEGSKRVEIEEKIIGEKKNYLVSGLEVEGVFFKEKLINVNLPFKIDLKVIESPPGIKGDTKSGGMKTVILETGKKIRVPLFIEAGDIIRINPYKNEYVARIKKSSGR